MLKNIFSVICRFSVILQYKRVALLCVVGVVFSPHVVRAHPHAWIDVQTEIIIDAAGNVTGLRTSWLFDEFYTEFAVSDFGIKKGDAANNEKLQNQKLEELGKTNLNNLKEYSYFTYIEVDKKRVDFSTYKDVKSSLVGHRINLSFTIMLDTPVNPHKKNVNIRVYDPTYYTEMKQRVISFSGNPTSCATRLIRPQPESTLITMAGALDKQATAPENLGRAFADRVLIICPPQPK